MKNFNSRLAEAKSKIAKIKHAYNECEISYEEAKEQAGTALDTINQKTREVARQYKQPFRPLTFAELMR